VLDVGIKCNDSVTVYTTVTYYNKVPPQRDVTVLARRAVSATRQHTRPTAGATPFTRPAAGSVSTRPAVGRQRYRWQTSTTDDSMQNNTGPLGGPVITLQIIRIRLIN